jgi:hypothetical protein
MKRVLKIVAVALAAVLTAQPALAGLTCGLKSFADAPCVPKCGKATSRMGASCPMHRHASGNECLQDCCRNGWPQAVVRSASKATPKASRSQLLPAEPGPAAAGNATFAALPEGKIAAAGPPRYILLQVFRI